MCQEEVKKSLTSQVAKQEKKWKTDRIKVLEFGRTLCNNKFSHIGSAGQLSFDVMSLVVIYSNRLHGGMGSIAQRLANLLPDPAAPG